jgi:hypothetical protein
MEEPVVITKEDIVLMTSEGIAALVLVASAWGVAQADMRTVYEGVCDNGIHFHSVLDINQDKNETTYTADIADSKGKVLASELDDLPPDAADDVNGDSVYNFKLSDGEEPYEVIIHYNRKNQGKGLIIRNFSGENRSVIAQCVFTLSPAQI